MKRRNVIVLSIVLLFTIAGILLVKLHQQEYYAVGRFLFQQNLKEPYQPYYTRTDLQTISNLLCSLESSNELSRISQVKGIFQLVQIRPVRGTSLLDVKFVGTDSNGVERVASNACIMIQRFYSTNQPTVQVELVEAGPASPPKPWWRLITSRLSEMF